MDNINDAVNRGINCRGSTHGHSKLTESEVVEMLRLKHAGWKNFDLAKKFNIDSVSTISGITRGATWKHVDRKAALTAYRKEMEK